MFRRFIANRIARSNSVDSADDSEFSNGVFPGQAPKVPPPTAFQSSSERSATDDSADLSVQKKVQELSNFDACMEACDALAASSTSSGRTDPITGIVDCSVLVSSDGDLLLIPQQQRGSTREVPEDESDLMPESKDNENNDKNINDSNHDVSPPIRTSDSMDSSLKELLLTDEEYKNAIFVGNDLVPQGDRAYNGFSANGWSIPAASLALTQTQQAMENLASFVEEIATTQSQSAIKLDQVTSMLRSLTEPHEYNRQQVKENQKFINETYPDQHLEILPTRVGPLSSPGGTIHATVMALEQYYSATAETDSVRWTTASTQQSGLLAKLRRSIAHTELRAANRQAALVGMFQKVKQAEQRLFTLKEDAQRKWDAVNEAEESVSRLVEQKMIERSRIREQQRMEQLKRDEERRARDNANGNFGATSSEIWDIVSSVSAAMEEGSFEPMDFPQAPLSVPRDKSLTDSNNNLKITSDDDDDDDGDDQRWELPVASRHELEQECGLPDLRSAAMAADEAVSDAANTLLNVLSNLDTTKRSARVAAEAAAVSASNAQAKCLRSMIKLERASLDARMRELQELEKVASNIDVRADMNHYITLDKKETGGRSPMGDDDDGGIASALAVLSSHVEGNLGMNTPNRVRVDEEPDTENEDSTTPELLEKIVVDFFEDIPALRDGITEVDDTIQQARDGFNENVEKLCKAVSDQTSKSRSRRSTICYSLNSKRSINAKVPSTIQFEGLCKVFSTILSNCGFEGSGVSLAKMCMMLSQTFYICNNDSSEAKDDPDGGAGGTVDEHSDAVREARRKRVYVKTKLMDHPLWKNDEFWDQTLYQCVTESLTHSGVMANFERPVSHILSSTAKKKSEWTETRKMRWHDLNNQERSEAASQVHAVVFAQIGALAHSMIEFGCGLERSCAFARRMSIRNQLPLSQRTMLLQHLIGPNSLDTEVKLVTPSR